MWTGPIKNSLTTTELFDDNGIFEILSEKDVGEECLEKVPLKILIFLTKRHTFTNNIQVNRWHDHFSFGFRGRYNYAMPILLVHTITLVN